MTWQQWEDKTSSPPIKNGQHLIWPRFSAVQFLSVWSFLIAAKIWYSGFSVVFCQAFCMWHWPIDRDLDLTFIWGHHHLQLVGMNDQSISWLFHYLLHRVLTRPNKVETAIHCCNSLHSVWTLSSRCPVKPRSFYAVSTLHRCFQVTKHAIVKWFILQHNYFLNLFFSFFILVGFLLKMMLLITGLCPVFLLYGNFCELKGFVITYWHSEAGNVHLNIYIFYCMIPNFLFSVLFKF